jgi:hypothetical protein
MEIQSEMREKRKYMPLLNCDPSKNEGFWSIRDKILLPPLSRSNLRIPGRGSEGSDGSRHDFEDTDDPLTRAGPSMGMRIVGAKTAGDTPEGYCHRLTTGQGSPCVVDIQASQTENKSNQRREP